MAFTCCAALERERERSLQDTHVIPELGSGCLLVASKKITQMMAAAHAGVVRGKNLSFEKIAGRAEMVTCCLLPSATFRCQHT